MKPHLLSLFSHLRRFCCLILPILTVLPVASHTAQAQDRAAPEASTGTAPTVQFDRAKKFMAVTSHPLATQAAYEVLKDQGSAADAAIAAQLVLGLVEPQSSGLGGGGFALYYDKQNKTLTAWDGRETAPANSGPDLFLNPDGTPMAFKDAYIGGRAVGVPGLPKLLRELHYKHGKEPWHTLFDPAIKIAAKGFDVTPRLAQLIEKNKVDLARYANTGIYFTDDFGQPLAAGSRLINKDYARTLIGFKNFGEDYFYDPDSAHNIVHDIVKAVQTDSNPGKLTARDFKNYRVIKSDPLCWKYKDYNICGMGEPSSGPLTAMLTLGILQHKKMPRKKERVNTSTLQNIIEASRLAFADRNTYMADPAFANTAGKKLLNNDYLDNRSHLIILPHVLPHAYPGKVKDYLYNAIDDEGHEEHGTTHISIVDQYGNIISMTSSIEQAFGSHLMVGGFLLNNQLTDFSFEPSKKGYPILNGVEAGKRPRSSMSPIIVFDIYNRPYLVLGSAGGSRIIGYMLQQLISILNWNIPLEKSLAMPHFLTRHQSPVVELEPELADIAPSLEALGYETKVTPLNSGLTGIQFRDDRIFGAADPRREGTAMGD